MTTQPNPDEAYEETPSWACLDEANWPPWIESPNPCVNVKLERALALRLEARDLILEGWRRMRVHSNWRGLLAAIPPREREAVMGDAQWNQRLWFASRALGCGPDLWLASFDGSEARWRIWTRAETWILEAWGRQIRDRPDPWNVPGDLFDGGQEG